MRAFHVASCMALVVVASMGSPAASAPPSLEIPKEVAPSGQYLIVLPKTDAVSVTYIGLDGIEPVPPILLSDKRAFVLDCYGKPAGRYRFAAVAAGKDGEQVRVDFVAVIGTPPVPPGPIPPPKPVPPDPPDPLATSVQAAFTTDTSATKLADARALAAVYRAVAEVLGDVKTAGELFTVLKGATEARISGRLKSIRPLFGGELGKVLPAEATAVLTAEQKAAAAKQLNRFAAVLEALK